MRIEVAYALPDEQFLFEQEVEEGCTIEQALKTSKLLEEFPDLNIDKVGIFGRLMPVDTPLREGDRIEVYRPLKVDPRERRRQQVEDERRQPKA
ncbi:MAG: RnfH family protein [Thiomicrorhabdus chilensis]|uniref:RnfH family protein n=1 Tax=Thiomicrorhabdus chilensis TaxID=63656 RepID=UPI0003F7620D|nr:RnfH family protein [Thiomicrorhabdus chilensis]MDX1347584.1 RnfH family protein [Thiomicrorhabdus chilensis]